MVRHIAAYSAAAVLVLAGAATTAFYALSTPSSPVETIYIVNHAGQYISNKTILADIPSWEQAANNDFAPIWHSERVKLELVKTAPTGAISALFVKDGPVQGALAYHTVTRGVPQVVIYAGTADYYGYSNSVSFTHELFELLADPDISLLNQGQPYPQYCLQGTGCQAIAPGTTWFNEVCDPVEASAYNINGVAISDFITPNWFNDQVTGPYDFMNEIQAPLVVDVGGYAQYWDGFGWHAVTNFRHAGRDASGFYKAEKPSVR